ncbi:MAG: RagB/SusD family nutrient uptake outer membrane protein [Bacteroidales bacterium]|nr:RagB/SusD family nutrient uptake outer membrane protein [Bacteroidales bacterium]
MNTIYKHIITLSLLPVLAASCIREAIPTDRATANEVTVETQITGMPAAMMMIGANGYGLPWEFALPAIHMATDAMSGDVAILGNIGYDWFFQWGTNTALGPDYAVGVLTWDNYYKWIKSANAIIGGIDPADISEKEKAFLGWAYVYRAICYLDLVRLYEFKPNKYTEGEKVIGLGVPIVLPETTEEMAKNNPRALVSDIHAMIQEDMVTAEQLLLSYKAESRYDITLGLVYGIRAKTYLDMACNDNKPETFALAAEYARKAITASGRTPLTHEQWEDPSNGFNNINANNSWIWGLPLPSEQVDNLVGFTPHMSTEQTWSAYGFSVARGINKNLYNSIPAGDFRKYSWLDPDLTIYSYKSTRTDAKAYFADELPSYSNIKFRPAQGDYTDFKTGGAADHPYMRVEEMYFIEAEAKAHASLQEGRNLLNTFMNSYRMMDGYKYDCTPKASTLKGFLNELMLMKRIEFWGEGIIMFDLKRLDMSSYRGYVGTNSPTSYRLNCDGRAPYWNFAISRGETQNNTALVGFNNPDPSDIIKPWTK